MSYSLNTNEYKELRIRSIQQLYRHYLTGKIKVASFRNSEEYPTIFNNTAIQDVINEWIIKNG